MLLLAAVGCCQTAAASGPSNALHKGSIFAPWHFILAASPANLPLFSFPRLPLVQAAYKAADAMLRTAVRGSQAIRVMAPLVGPHGSTPLLPPGFDAMLDTWISRKPLAELIANFEVRLHHAGHWLQRQYSPAWPPYYCPPCCLP